MFLLLVIDIRILQSFMFQNIRSTLLMQNKWFISEHLDILKICDNLVAYQFVHKQI